MDEEVMQSQVEASEDVSDAEGSERFKEDLKDRMSKICQQIEYLERLAGKRTANYSKEDADKMFAYLEKRLDNCKEVFYERFEDKKKDFDFEF